MISSFQFIGDKIIERGAVAVGFADPTLEVITQASHGFNTMGVPFEVTRSELNRIFELEGQPAWKFITNIMGAPETAGFFEIGPAFWARELPEDLHREYGNTHITPAAKYPTVVIPAKAGHEVKLSRYPERHWMPDQARHDGVGYLVARLIFYLRSSKKMRMAAFLPQ
jgi:hypothetical protein